MTFGVSNDVLGIYTTPSLFRFRIPLCKIGYRKPDFKNIEVQYHIFSNTSVSPLELRKGPRHIEDFLKSNQIAKFSKGGWLIATTDNSQLSNEKSKDVYNLVLINLQKIWLNESAKWDCTGATAFYNDTDTNRKVSIYDVNFIL
jgi:hypothetical protein